MSSKIVTENAIKETFVKLLKDKPLRNITIKEIAEECNINRNTFYYHYSGIPALVESIMNDEADRIIAKTTNNLTSLEDCLNAILDFVKDNRTAILHIYHSINRATFEKYLWKISRRSVEVYIDNAPKSRRRKIAADKTKTADRDLIIDLYVSQCFGLTMHWINNGLSDQLARKDVKRICRIFSKQF